MPQRSCTSEGRRVEGSTGEIDIDLSEIERRIGLLLNPDALLFGTRVGRGRAAADGVVVVEINLGAGRGWPLG
jgi:hypothetical protein